MEIGVSSLLPPEIFVCLEEAVHSGVNLDLIGG